MQILYMPKINFELEAEVIQLCHELTPWNLQEIKTK